MNNFILKFLVFLAIISCSSTNFYRYNERNIASNRVNCLDAIKGLYVSGTVNDPQRLIRNLDDEKKEEVLDAIERFYERPFEDSIGELNGLLGANAKFYSETPRTEILSFFKNLFNKDFKFVNIQKAGKFLSESSDSLSLDLMDKTFKAASVKPNFMLDSKPKSIVVDSVGLAELEDIPYIRIISKETDENQSLVDYKALDFDEMDQSFFEYLQDSSLAAQIKALQAKKNAKDKEKLKVMEKVYRSIIDKELRAFQPPMGNVDVSDAASIESYVKEVAKVYQRLSLINPYPGQYQIILKKMVIDNLLEKQRLLPARIGFSNVMPFQTINQIQEQIFSGMLATQRLYEDLANRVELGLPLEKSPEWFSPLFDRYIGLTQKVQGKKDWNENFRFEEIDARQFLYWFEHYLSKNPSMKSKLSNNPIEAIESIRKKYTNWVKQKRVVYHHAKEGEQIVSVNFVDNEFRALFGEYTASDAKKFKAKKDMWYLDETVWRGMAFKDRTVTDQEIATMFKYTHHMLVSNKALGSFRGANHERGVAIINRQFDDYNNLLFEDNLLSMVTDHQNEGAQYWSSFGMSTSRKYAVGRAFAAGAMKDGVAYGQQYTAEHQAKFRSRVLVGMTRAKKDIELNKFRQVEPEFMSTYARQVEVVSVGGADPDSVEVIHTLGPDNGMAEFSYIRDPERPNIINKYEGLVYPEDLKEDNDFQVIQSFDLNEVSEMN